jgi:hypothetical protein
VHAAANELPEEFRGGPPPDMTLAPEVGMANDVPDPAIADDSMLILAWAPEPVLSPSVADVENSDEWRSTLDVPEIPTVDPWVLDGPTDANDPVEPVAAEPSPSERRYSVVPSAAPGGWRRAQSAARRLGLNRPVAKVVLVALAAAGVFLIAQAIGSDYPQQLQSAPSQSTVTLTNPFLPDTPTTVATTLDLTAGAAPTTIATTAPASTAQTPTTVATPEPSKTTATTPPPTVTTPPPSSPPPSVAARATVAPGPGPSSFGPLCGFAPGTSLVVEVNNQVVGRQVADATGCVSGTITWGPEGTALATPGGP